MGIYKITILAKGRQVLLKNRNIQAFQTDKIYNNKNLNNGNKKEKFKNQFFNT